MEYIKLSETHKKRVRVSSNDSAQMAFDETDASTHDIEFTDEVNNKFNKTFKSQVAKEEGLEKTFAEGIELLSNAVLVGFDKLLKKKLEPSYEDLRKNLTSTLISHASGLVGSILRSKLFFSTTETLIEKKEFVVDGMAYRVTIERMGSAKEIDVKDYMSFNFRSEVQAAKKAWLSIFERIAPTQRKIAMFRATKEILDIADRDVEALRKELEVKLKKSDEKQDFVEGVERKIEPMRMWVNRNIDETAEQFIESNWRKYIAAGLVDRGIVRYDMGFLSHLSKYKPALLAEYFPVVGQKTQMEIQCLVELGYTHKELVRLYTKAKRME